MKPSGKETLVPRERFLMLVGRSGVGALRARLDLEEERQMRPTSMLMQPTEKRKKAATRANSSM